MDKKSCILEKDTTFTYFATKMLHISASKVCKDVYIYTLATVTMYIYTVTVARPFIILLIFSLSCL